MGRISGGKSTFLMMFSPAMSDQEASVSDAENQSRAGYRTA